MLLLNLARRNRLFTQSASNAVTLLGGLVLARRQLQIQEFRGILRGLVSMGPEYRGGNVPLRYRAQSFVARRSKEGVSFLGIGLDNRGDCSRTSDFQRMFFWPKVGAGGLWN